MPASPLMVRKVASAPDSQVQGGIYVLRMPLAFAGSPRYQEHHSDFLSSLQRVPRLATQANLKDKFKLRTRGQSVAPADTDNPLTGAQALASTASPPPKGSDRDPISANGNRIPVPSLASHHDIATSSPQKDPRDPLKNKSHQRSASGGLPVRPLPNVQSNDLLDRHVDELCQAIQEGDVAQVQAAIYACPPGGLNVPHNETGRTALYEAVARGNTSLVALLLAQGADPNIGHATSGPPLLHAAAWGENEIVELLLAKVLTPSRPPTDPLSLIIKRAPIRNDPQC
jgi:hypothetical protein